MPNLTPTSKASSLTWLALLSALVLPAGQPPVWVGQQVSFSVTADGTPTPTFEWFKDDTKISEGDTFIIYSAKLSDSGTYIARATNSAGSADSAPEQLTVRPSAPSITAIEVK
jgi:hypothetical protein